MVVTLKNKYPNVISSILPITVPLPLNASSYIPILRPQQGVCTEGHVIVFTQHSPIALTNYSLQTRACALDVNSV